MQSSILTRLRNTLVSSPESDTLPGTTGVLPELVLLLSAFVSIGLVTGHVSVSVGAAMIAASAGIVLTSVLWDSRARAPRS